MTGDEPNMNTHKQKTTHKAFTLIELLVVIAVIAILAAILFPVFARARENARRTSCIGNMKQIGLAVMQYSQDYDERYPLSVWQVGDISGTTNQVQSPRIAGTPAGTYGSGEYTFMDFLVPYVKNTQIYNCPSYTSPYPTSASWNSASSYGYNTFLSGYRQGGSTYPSNPPMALADVKRAAETVMMMDHPYAIHATPGAYCSISSTGFQNPTRLPYYNMVFPHFEGGVVTFADGHAKWFKRGAKGPCDRVTTSSSSNLANWPWNPALQQ